MTNIIYLGIDASLNSTGLCVYDTSSKKYRTGNIKRPVYKDKRLLQDDEHWKAEALAQFKDFLSPYSNKKIIAIFEEYAFAKNKGKMFTRAELCGAYKSHLYNISADYYTISPMALKKYIFGHGKGTKANMAQAVKEKYKISFKNDDIVDAFAIVQYFRALHEKGEDLKFSILNQVN